MPLLANPQHERFAQARAEGRPLKEAYAASGYAGSGVTRWKISRHPEIQARVRELQARAAAKTEVTAEKIVRELVKIAFADIRTLVNWSGPRPGDEAGRARRKRRGDLELLASNAIDDDSAAAIAEVWKTAHGIRFKLHDKRAALVALGKHVGLFERTEDKDGPVPWFIAGEPIENLDKWVERYKPMIIKDPAQPGTKPEGASEPPAINNPARQSMR